MLSQDILVTPFGVSVTRNLDWGEWLEIPITTTVTPALCAARFFHLNEVLAKTISVPSHSISGQNIGTCCPWQIEFVATNAAEPPVAVMKPLAFQKKLAT